jgi:hypothetical protein
MSDFEWSSGEQYAPEGIYEGEFLGYELLPATVKNGEQLEEAVKWMFVIKGGDHDGKQTSNIGNKKPTDKNISGRIIRGLLGGAFKPGDKPDVKSCIGKRYTVGVQNNRNGRPVVVQVQPK